MQSYRAVSTMLKATSRLLMKPNVLIKSRNFATQGPTSSIIKPIILGIGIGVVGGTGYTLFVKQTNIPGEVLKEKPGPLLLDKFPDVKITRSVENSKDDTGLELVSNSPNLLTFSLLIGFFKGSISISNVSLLL